MSARNHNYKGGTTSSHKYRLQYVGKDHHLADVRGYAYEHRLEAEKKLGRRLNKGEIVHHLDGNTMNNAHDNLEVVSGIAEHLFLHRRVVSDKRKPGDPNPVVSCSCGCGGTFAKYDKSNRPRRYITGHNPNQYVKNNN